MQTAIELSPIIAAVLWHALVWRLTPKLGLVKPNFKGDPIMASYGIASFAYMVALMFVFAPRGSEQHILLYLWVVASMCLLGAADDIWGTRGVGGFVGHFRKLFAQGKLTTGAVKAIGGGIVGIAAGRAISGGEALSWLLAAALIPLMANTLNLVDLRPGRAVAVFFLGLGVTYISVWGRLESGWIVAAIAWAAFLWAIPDSRGKAMMGDSGSNSLGAALGLTIALNTGVYFQAVAIAALAALHVYSERHSISDLIEQHEFLRRVDRLLGVR